MSTIIDAAFWQSRWQKAETGWDLRNVSPPLAAYIDQIPDNEKGKAILMPGCGNGYEALHLLEKGFTNITMLDIAPEALEHLKKQTAALDPALTKGLHLICGDFFEQSGPAYDLILEQTFFCALDPVLRTAYARQMHALLQPGGTLAGVLFDRDFPGGPPFGGSQAEYERLFRPLFRIKTLAPCYNSTPARDGTEVFLIVQKG